MRSSLEIFDIATGTSRMVFQTPDLIEAPNWDPSGDTLLFNGDGRLFRIEIDGGSLRAVVTGFADRCNNDHGISPDGGLIALSHHTAEGSVIYTVPAGGGTPRRVTEAAGSYWHGWSPDGARLAFCGKRDGRFDIHTIAVDGGAETRLTGLDRAEDGHNDGPDYAPDGRTIWFNSDRTGHAQIWRMGVDGSDPRQMTGDDRVNWFPHPSPNGASILYLSYPPGTEGHPADKAVELRLMDLGGGNIRTILALNGGQGTINVPCWSPRSDAFAFVKYRLTAS